MQTEPIITTNNMSVDDVAAWITEKARDTAQLATLRSARESHQRKLEHLDKEIAECEARSALTVTTQ